ncbi:TPA: DUF5376 family protein [Pasteurella multocida]|uniref:DUF5376 domain-containing protein n=1 Tax=Pasteurella multocida TaxID=747 RepID=A0A9X3ZKK4_PASMD|nr:DUF5376 domain-containing protein [Pasteurella multocida]AWW59449.1 hypothetical protein C4O88_02585 [Pasteurellaceae bacterium 12591]AET15484.1 hypothetical protein Pmu_05670 [Pasteurella multocida 36950]AHE63968.1 hypothetical protein PMCN03_0503 [Pasteurella multocida subsp. multocida str. HB03]AIN48063.1 hypothetical protein DR93_1280 [Pasteurella multocida]ANJ89739.1 hypothetical protein PMCN01_0501 [Pasteurella multocida subsp. multocida HB01]
MKVLFSYGTYNNRPHKACCVYESNNRENDEVIIDYLSTLERLSWMSKVLEMLRDSTITRDWISSQSFDALIDHDQIKVGFYLLDDMEEEDIPDDVDERDTAPRFIPRKEFAYLLEKWLDFYHRPITDMNY